MIVLTRGDRLPTVAVVQLLLNSLLPDRRPPLVIDGDCGPNTEAAVGQFHQQTHSGVAGRIVGPATWAALTGETRFQVRDIVDIFDPLLYRARDVLRSAGSQPIEFGGGSNAVTWVAPAVAGSGVQMGRLALLRIMGHGNHGSQVIGYGTSVRVIFDAIRRQPVPDPHTVPRDPAQLGITPAEIAAMRLATSRSGISSGSLELAEVAGALRRLRPLFSPSGSVELHGCQVAGGEAGPPFLQQLADILGVPVSASRVKQTVGNAIRFRPPVITRFPGGHSLSAWARSLSPIQYSIA